MPFFFVLLSRFINLNFFQQINTLEQLKNANNYRFLKDKITNNKLRGYAIWLDTQLNEAYLFSYSEKRFVKINENSYEKLYKEASLENQNHIFSSYIR